MKTQERVLNILFYFSILLFFLGFNFTDNPPSGWYLQTLPNLNGKQINDITFLDSLNGVAVARQTSDSSYILKTTNSGDNWTIIYRSFLAMEKIQFLNINTGYAVGAYLFKTTNGGFNWNQVTAPPISPENMYVLNEDTIWIISSEPLTGGVFRTTNGGLNWTQQLSSGSQNPDKIYMYNARIGFICKSSSNAYFRKTTDGGNSWFTILSNESFTDIYFVDSLTGWRTWDYIKKTTNGGLNWVNQSIPEPYGSNGGVRKISVINRDTIWGSYQSIIYPNTQMRGLLYRTTNGGNNWYYQIPDTSFRISRFRFIQFINKNIGWAYASGSGVHTITGGDTTIFTPVIQTNTEIPKDYILYQNYPNPFNPKTTIEYEIKRSGYITLAVYDIRGKEMTTLVSQKQTPGKYLVDFPGVLFPNGVYFYRLSTDGKPIATKKMMLIK